MKSKLLDYLMLFLAFSLLLAFVWVQVPSLLVNASISAIVVMVSILIRSYLVNHITKVLGFPLGKVMYFWIYLIVGLFVWSTGGFSSPYFSLVYVWIIGLGFFSSIEFALPTYASVVIGFLLHERILGDVQLQSFLAPLIFGAILMPAYHYLLRTFNARAQVFRLLHERFYLQLPHHAELLRNVGEIVIVANHQLRIISMNKAARDVLGFDVEDTLFKLVYSVIKLQDSNGIPIDREGLLEIPEMRKDCETRIFEPVRLQTKEEHLMVDVTLQINPVCSGNNKVQQFVFVMKQYQPSQGKIGIVKRLDTVLAQHQELLQMLRRELSRNSTPDQMQSLERFNEVEKDLLTMIEIEESLAAEPYEVVDVITEMSRIMREMIRFASSFGVSVHFKKIEAVSNTYSFTTPQGQDITWHPGYSEGNVVLTQRKWLHVMLQKAVNMSVLLASKQTHPEVRVSYELSEDRIVMWVKTSFRSLSEKESISLFERDHGHLGKTSFLHLGSGLEGYLAKRVANHLGYEIRVIDYDIPPKFGLEVIIWRNPR